MKFERSRFGFMLLEEKIYEILRQSNSPISQTDFMKNKSLFEYDSHEIIFMLRYMALYKHSISRFSEKDTYYFYIK